MRPGRELDTRVAREIFGHEVWATNKTLHERAEGVKRPLRQYSRDLTSAWEVAEKMRISLLPIEGNQWFAFSGTGDGWKSPQEFIEVLQKGDFVEGGAAVAESAALAICLAALKACEKEKFRGEAEVSPLRPENPQTLQ
jgi:hypothetical protein